MRDCKKKLEVLRFINQRKQVISTNLVKRVKSVCLIYEAKRCMRILTYEDVVFDKNLSNCILSKLMQFEDVS